MLPDFGMSSSSRVPFHPEEADRLAAVCGLCVAGPARDPLLNRVAQSAATLLDAPIGLVTFVEESTQKFGGRMGLDVEETTRDESFCAYTILHEGPLVVEDALKDPRFAHLPIVAQAPFVRSYFGAPVVDAGGMPLGSVCVLDVVPRPVPFQGLAGLLRLAAKVGVILEARRLVRELAEGHSSEHERRALDRLEAILSPLGDRIDESRKRRT